MRSLSFLGVVLMLTLAAMCPGQDPTGDLLQGTWGGDNAAAIVSDSMHVHIGCTSGNAPRPTLTAGGFEVSGLYNVNAYPVNLGIFHPARFTGHVSGKTLSLTVTLTDTAVTLGPVSVELGREPKMGPCPICRVPSQSMGWIRRLLGH